MSPQRFVITVKIGFASDAALLYYSENATSDFMVSDIHKAKVFATLDYAEGIAELLPKSLYSHLEYVQLNIVECKDE
jgi:hypothetical protein